MNSCPILFRDFGPHPLNKEHDLQMTSPNSIISRPCIDELWVDSRKALNKDYDESKHATLRVYVIVIVFFLGTLGCALGLPDVTVAVNFTGSIASFFCAVLPGNYSKAFSKSIQFSILSRDFSNVPKLKVN